MIDRGSQQRGSKESPDRVVELDVLGTPAPKGSNRAMLRGGRAVFVPGGSKVNAGKLRGWDANVRHSASEALGARAEPVFVGVPLHVELEFRMTRPAGHWGKHGIRPSAPMAPATKPDADKLARSTLDSLTGLVFDDDSRIVELVVRKVYAAPGQEGARIVVCEWPGPVDAILDVLLGRPAHEVVRSAEESP